MEEEIEKLKKRIEELEKRPYYVPYYPPPYIQPTYPGRIYLYVHYHGTTPCYMNPCIYG